ncbi:hypothetical protein R84981_001971 [Carnimonas sp. R-84981]|uniref:hypothetical protein n=1 Tax=Carnimonas bestiolae TaxID=3402172 RepID=UPI003EDCA0BB
MSDNDHLILTVDTTATLKELVDGLKEGQKISTLGYYEVGDGGATLYEVSKTKKDFAIKVSGLYLNPVVDNVINLRQIGFKDGDEISDVVEKLLVSGFQHIHIPKGNYLFTKRKSIEAKNSVGITGEEGTELIFSMKDGAKGREHCISIQDNFVGFSKKVESLRSLRDSGKYTQITDESPVGQGFINVDNVPSEVEVGDIIYIANTRSQESENRSRLSEGQVSKITNIENNKIWFSERTIFNYKSNLTITGSVKNIPRNSEDSCYIRVSFDDDKYNASLTYDLRRDLEACIKFDSGWEGQVGRIIEDDNGEHMLYLSYDVPEGDSLPKDGEKFTITNKTFVGFRKPHSFSLSDISLRWEYKDSNKSNNTAIGNTAFRTVGFDNPIFTNIVSKVLSGGIARVRECYRGSATFNYVDGNMSTNRKQGFTVNCFSIESTHNFQVLNNHFSAIGQAINIDGRQTPSMFTLVKDNYYYGGGSFEDGSDMYPYQSGNPNNDNRPTTSFYAEHGGSYFTRVEGNTVVDSYEPFGLIRGHGTQFINNEIYGAVGKSVFVASKYAGVTIKSNRYYQTVKTCDYLPYYTYDGETPDFFLDYGVSSANYSLYPTILEDNYSEALNNGFVGLTKNRVSFDGYSGRTKLENFLVSNNSVKQIRHSGSKNGEDTIENNTGSSTLGSYFWFDVTNGGHYTANESFQIFDNNNIIRKDILKNISHFGFYRPDRISPEIGHAIYHSNNKLSVVIEDDNFYEVPLVNLEGGSFTVFSLDIEDSVIYEAVNMGYVRQSGSTLISGVSSRKSDNVGIHTTTMNGTRWDDDKLNIGIAIPDSQSNRLSLFIENRTGKTRLIHVKVD